MTFHYRPETIAETAAVLATFDRAALDAVVSPAFLNEMPTLESWRRPLAVFLPPAVVESHFKNFLVAPRVNEELLDSYAKHFIWSVSEQNNNGATRPLNIPELRFDPAATDITQPLEKRTTCGDTVYALGLLRENPHILVTVAALQTFFVDYVSALRTATIMENARHAHNRAAPNAADFDPVFARFAKTFSTNEALFGGTMAAHFMLVHAHHASREGRPVGVLTKVDFGHFMGYASHAKMFKRKHEDGRTVVCPFASYFRAAASAATDEPLTQIQIGARLGRLHEAVTPVAERLAPGLRRSMNQAYWDAVNTFDVSPKQLLASSLG
jgi:hypothetical protein